MKPNGLDNKKNKNKYKGQLDIWAYNFEIQDGYKFKYNIIFQYVKI